MEIRESSNPYEPSQLPSQRETAITEDGSLVRPAVYLHLVAIVGCALLTLTDTQRLKLPALAQETLWFFAMPIVFTYVICPSITIAVAWKAKDRSNAFKLSVTALAISMTLIQLWVCLPLVQ